MCEECNKDIVVKNWQTVKYKRSFCSKGCEGSWKKKNTGGINNPRFSKQEVFCSWCGSILLRKKSELLRSKHFFCGVKCNGQWKVENLVGEKIYNYKGSPSCYRGENWNIQRRLARKRDNDTCQRCFKTKVDTGRNMDVHHVVPFIEFGLKNYESANRLENLICYCNSCHKIVEAELEKKKLEVTS